MLNLRIDREQLWVFSGFALITLCSVLFAFATRQYMALIVPLLLVFGYITLIDFKQLFYLLLFLLPLSTEVTIGSFGTDLPDEPLMVILMFAFFLFVFTKPQFFPFKFLKHPIILLLLLHFCWMAFIIFFAQNHVVSFKFLLAKTWYIVAFVFVTAAIVTKRLELKRFFWLIYIPLTLTIVQTLVRYAAKGFDFEFVNEPLYPFYRNHVNYAAMVTIFYPFIFLAATWYERGTWKRQLLQFSKVFYIIGIYFSYTRACYLAVILAGICYVLVHFRLLSWTFRILLVGVIVFVVGLSIKNNYLKLAPDYDNTIHHKDFAQHLKATYELKDVSSMERVYRWVAAFHMIPERPVFGFGMGNFYPYYQHYTVNDFVTYTSDNEEQSTVHNYFLLTAVEQGIPGLILFLIFSLSLFHYGEKRYLAESDPEKRAVIMTVLLSLVIVYVNLSLSDLVEVDKTGSLLFMNVALLVNVLTDGYKTAPIKIIG